MKCISKGLWRYKIPGWKWADEFTNRPLGAVLGILLAAELWLGVLAVVHYEWDQRRIHWRIITIPITKPQ